MLQTYLLNKRQIMTKINSNLIFQDMESALNISKYFFLPALKIFQSFAYNLKSFVKKFKKNRIISQPNIHYYVTILLKR